MKPLLAKLWARVFTAGAFVAIAGGALSAIEGTASAGPTPAGPTPAADSYLQVRPIEGAAGWTRLELPDDVLDACRAGLADLRIVTDSGEELPYTLGSLAKVALRWPAQNAERTANIETTAIVDRGEHPVAIDDVTLGIEGTDFLKPLVIEASDDGAQWKQVAHASVFATAEPARARMTRVSFAPNNRRYLRLRIDDRNSDPVTVTSVIGHAAGPATVGAHPPHEVRIAPVPGGSAAADASTYVAELPAAHLAVAGLRIETTEPAFARDVRVYDRVVYRGEVSRRLVGAAHLLRGAAGPEQTVVPIAGPTGRTLEIEVTRAAGRALPIAAFVAFVSPTAVIFHAPVSAALTLRYGSAAARPPAYDLAEALALAPPSSLAEAHLGPSVPVSPAQQQAAAAALSAALPVRFAATIDPAGWRSRRPITLPGTGAVASLSVDRRAEQLSSLRIIDEQNRQIPYVAERDPRLSLVPASFVAMASPKGGAQAQGTSDVSVTGIDPAAAIDALELDTSEPFFEREVTVEETVPSRRDRGDLERATRRVLGSARWVRRPDETGPLRIAMAQPDQTELFVSFRDGAERPLTLSRVSIQKVERRFDFLFTPGQTLALLFDNPAASAPHYDLALLAERIADVPAEAASLGAAESTGGASERAGSRWLWAAVAVAAIGVTATLVRTLRTTLPPTVPPGP